MRQYGADAVRGENTGLSGGPSGARSHDLRIKRPYPKRTLRSGNSDAACMAADPPRNTGGTHESGSRSRSIGLKIGARVRITAGQAQDVVGVVIAEYVPLKPKAWRTWTVKTDDLVGRREIRHDYLEVIE